MIRELVSQLFWRRYLSRGARPIREVAEFAARSKMEQQQALAERLLMQVRYFGKRPDALPEWREAARIKDPLELWRIWPFLPIVTKELLRTQFSPEDMPARFQLEGQQSATGGSTGEPVRFFHDRLMLQADLALHTYTRRRMGWHPGMATVIVWGSERDIRKSTALKSRVSNRLLRNHVIGGYHVNRQTVDRVLKAIRTSGPVAMYGFSSLLEYVAREALQGGPLPPPGGVHTAWNGGEVLAPEQVEVFRQAFSVPILNRYGSRELPVMACQFKDRGPLHVLRPWIFCEVVDAQGRPAAPGETGRLLWTSTVCQGTPFLRYEVGDLGSFDSGQKDDAGIAALREVQGRYGGTLKLPDGRQVSSLYWNHLLKEFAEVRQFQVVVRSDGGLRLLLKGGGFSPPREARLRGTIQHFMGMLPLQISWVDEVPRTAQGKLIQVVRE